MTIAGLAYTPGVVASETRCINLIVRRMRAMRARETANMVGEREMAKRLIASLRKARSEPILT